MKLHADSGNYRIRGRTMTRVVFSFFAIITGLLTGTLAASDKPSPPWAATLDQAAFTKNGLDRLHHPHYEYECLGLGGTVARIDPFGFTTTPAIGINTNGYLKHLPYLSYQYWWDEESHRHVPFELNGGYGAHLATGQASSFRHHLDIATGLLTIDLGLKVATTGTHTFQSHRELFVTPNGVLVIRITDAPNAPTPFQLQIDTNKKVRIYLNQGVYAHEHDPWSGTASARPEGLVVTATRPKSCVATLAVAADGANITLDPQALRIGSTRPGKTLTFYIAPGSSYESGDPASAAWEKAASAKKRGYAASRSDTARWWSHFYARSSVTLPDTDLAGWYARSTYYLGVFFGRTDVPPGCNGTSVESFAGAVCPEYDLVLDQQALLLGNHFDEARRVVNWLGRTLPRAERYATEGLTLHKVATQYTNGAKFGPLMGYDGTLLVPPTEGEGVWAHEDFAGNNAALMALNYVDWSDDKTLKALAERILKETTRISAADLQWRPDLDSYLNKDMPSTVQQAATRFGLEESLRRGVAEPGWNAQAPKVLIPTGDYQGAKVLTGGPGSIPTARSGDATWLSPVWWYSVIAPDNPVVRSSYDLFRTSTTGNYVFNNGWMGVIAAKLRDGAEALRWAREFLRPDATLFDDTCLGELIGDFEDFKKTPEVAAHAALLCNINQMLLDPDDDKTITVFPAIPAQWETQGVAFDHLAAKGDILVSGELKSRQVRVILENRSGLPCQRTLRLRLPSGISLLRPPLKGVRLENGWAVLPDLPLVPQGKTILTFNMAPPTEPLTRFLLNHEPASETNTMIEYD